MTSLSAAAAADQSDIDEPALYAVCAGTWTLVSHRLPSSYILSRGQIAASVRPGPHRWTAEEPAHRSQRQSEPAADVPLLLRIGFECDPVPVDLPGWSVSEGAGLKQFNWIQHLSRFPPGRLAVPRESADGLAALLLPLILGQLRFQNQHATAPSPLRQVDADVQHVLDCIEKEPERAWTIESLADGAGISRSGLAQKFKEQTGTTPKDYLLNVRMKLAAEMLSQRRQHLKEIARRSGYRSVSAFSTAFKRWSGRTPTDQRNLEKVTEQSREILPAGEADAVRPDPERSSDHSD